MATYRFVRWDITARKDPANSVQVGEFEVRNSGVTQSWPGGTTVACPYFGSNTTEVPANLIDGTTSKTLDFGYRVQSQVVFSFSSFAVAPSFDGYRFRTANDRPESDPVSWTLEGSFDGSNWYTIDTKTLHDPVPTARSTLTAEFELTEAVRFKHLRWNITHVRQLGAHSLAVFVDRVAADEFQLLSGGSPVSWPGGTTVTNPSGVNPSGEGPDKLIDGSTSTKWTDSNSKAAGDALELGLTRYIIDCGSGNSVTFNAYRWRTANDNEPRDPRIWSVYGSNDGTNWDLLGAESTTVTSSRDTFTSDFTIGRVEGTTGEKLLFGTQGLRFGVRTPNLLSDSGFENGVSGWATDDVDENAFARIHEPLLLLTRTGRAYARLWNEGTPLSAHVVSPRVTVTEGHMYEATVWVQRQSAHGVNQAAMASITFWRSNGTLHSTVNGAQLKIPNGGTWYPIRVSTSAPIGFDIDEAALRITHVGPNAGDMLLIDDVFLGEAAVTTTFSGGSPTAGSITGIGPDADGAFVGQNLVDGAFTALGPNAEAAFIAEHEGARIDLVGPAALAAFVGDTIAPNEAELELVGPGASLAMVGDPAHPDLRIQPVDVRPRRGRLGSRLFPARARDPRF